MNLEKATERKHFISHQFTALQEQHPDIVINYQFFTGVNGNTQPNHPLFAKYNQKKRYQRKGNEITLGQLGCYASHYLLWEKCVQLQQPIIVLEDDAILQPNFLAVYQFCFSAENQFEFFWLTHSNSSKIRTKLIHTLPDSTKLEQHYFGYSNTTGYYLTPQAAQKFLEHSQEWIYNVDIFMDRFYENHVALLGVNPPCVKPDFSKQSQITMNKNNRTFWVKLRREYFALLERIKRFVYWMFYC
ncbi:glycosyltransferase family 25 protein [Histophilus somni]|uniref:glycosyltransferase family 25 protein n=1 Tax=Histophilus somni TaxID=731 RepID=UPI0022B8FF7F|nr:glycosyltransferase family 25 protein [Histophilus somni]